MLSLRALPIALSLASLHAQHDQVMLNEVEGVMEVIRLVEKHHVQPPARQTMLLAAARAFHQARETYGRNPLGPNEMAQIAREVSALQSEEDAEAYLLQSFEDHPVTPYRWKERRPPKLAVAAMQAASPRPQELAKRMSFHRFQPAPHHGSHDPDSVEQQQAENRYVGIGIIYRTSGEYPMADKVFPRGPAKAAGMRDGDLMLTIDGDSMAGVKPPEIVKRLRGQRGKYVTIEVRQPNEEEVRRLTFQRGIVPRVALSGVEDLGNGVYNHRITESVAYVRLLEIGSSTLHDLRQVAKSFDDKEGQSLILDLRYVIEAEQSATVMIADSLLAGGEIGRVQTRKGERFFIADSDCLFRDWKLWVLIDGQVSGLVEWLARALRHNRRASLVGEVSADYPFEVVSYPAPRAGYCLIEATLLKLSGSHGALQPDHPIKLPEGDPTELRELVDELSRVPRSRFFNDSLLLRHGRGITPPLFQLPSSR